MKLLGNVRYGISFRVALQAVSLFALLIIAGGLVWNNQRQSDELATQYNQLVTRYNALVKEYAALKTTNGNLNGSLTMLEREMETLLQNYDRNRLVYRTPGANVSLDIWSINQTVQPHGHIVWALLDTFVNHIDVTTSSSARFMIMGIESYVLFRNYQPYVLLDNYTGTHYLRTERLSQGCTGYLLVVENISSSPLQVHPNVTAIFAPTPFLTGECSLTP